MVSSRPSGRAHDGDGAVFQAVDLIQAAGLVARGHEEHIRSGFNFVGDGVVECYFGGDFVGELFIETLEHFFVELVARARTTMIISSWARRSMIWGDEIEALLRGES